MFYDEICVCFFRTICNHMFHVQRVIVDNLVDYNTTKHSSDKISNSKHKHNNNRRPWTFMW